MSRCSENVNDKRIVIVDKGSGSKNRMIFINENQHQIKKTLVDGCEIETGIRCDFLVTDHNNMEYYIELKGTDILHACSQIEETILKISKNKLALKRSFIVSTACPPSINGTIQIKRLHFKKKYNSSLIIKNRVCEYKLI